MEKIAENLWVMRFPLSVLGVEIGRTVTIIRLNSGKLLIHSTAPFTPENIKTIESLGQPAWLLDATLFHDTFAKRGRRAFPHSEYFAPPGFPECGGPMNFFATFPAEWRGEMECLPVNGMPKVREHLVLHIPSKTLILADLLFNFGDGANGFTRWFFRNVGGVKQFPGISRLFRAAVKDRTQFQESMERILAWDFNRVIVAHGEIINKGGKEALRRSLREAGF